MDSERLIAKYFLNQLSAEEKVMFDNLIQTNSEFKEQVEFEEKVKKSIFQQEHTHLKQQLQHVEKTISSKHKRNTWYLVAASIVILLSISILRNFNSATPKKLFDTYYTVASNTSHPIVRDTNVSDTLTKAFIAYESKQYAQAQALFSTLYHTTNNSELLFYEGICYLEMGNTTLAIETFIKHKNFNDKLASKRNWYLALAYLKNNNVSKAKNILKEITTSSTNYNYTKAKDLLSKL